MDVRHLIVILQDAILHQITLTKYQILSLPDHQFFSQNRDRERIALRGPDDRHSTNISVVRR